MPANEWGAPNPPKVPAATIDPNCEAPDEAIEVIGMPPGPMAAAAVEAAWGM